VALLGARRTAPPELLAACIAAGIPVLARRNAAIEAWAARHPGRIEILPEGERPFAAALAAWASFAPSAGGEAAPPLPDSAALRARGPDASLVPLPNPLPPVVAAAAQGRWVLDQGRIRVAQPGMAAALLRAALASGRPVATCAASPGALPLGPEPDLAFLDPGATLGEAVLVDGEACRALGAPGKAVLAALGTPALPAAIAAAGLRVIALPAPLHEPLPPREVPEGERLALAAPAFPEALRDGLRLLLPPPPRATFADPHEEALARPLDRADRDGPDGPRHLARLLETLGHFDAALDAWAELRRRAPHDEEALVAQAALRFRRHGVPPDEAAVAQLRRAKRLHVLDAALGAAMVGSARLGERPIPPAPPDEDEDTDAGEGP